MAMTTCPSVLFMYILLLFLLFTLTGLTGLTAPSHFPGEVEDLDALRLSYAFMYS